MFAPFDYPFVQRGLVEVSVLAVAAGVLGTWIVLRGLAFFTHAVGTAAFPGLVLADGLGFSAGVGALGAAAVFALGVELLAPGRRRGRDSLTALVLVGALALGVILASDVFHSGAEVETLLFGSLLLVGQSDIAFAAVVGLAVLAATLVLGRRWLAAGFDAESARAIVGRTGWSDAALLLLVAVAVTAALSAVGALLVSALFVVPAATTRLWFRRLASWQIATVVVALAEGVIGLWASVQLNVPPGAAIAVLSGCVFAAASAATLVPGRRLVAVATLVLAVAVLAGCGGTGGSGGGGPSAVATTTQIGDWVRTVGGRDVDVHQILQPNTDPHEYEPRPADIVATAGGKLVFENGDRLDHWMGKVVSEAGGKPKVVVLGNRVPVRLRGEAGGPEASRYDPHWWHDPRNAEAAVAAVRDALAGADPGHAAAYRARAAAYLRRLRSLDRSLAACFGRIPARERKLVTDHDAFHYFAHRYGIRIVGAVIPSQTTAAQPSAGDTARLIRVIRREYVKAVFPESSANKKLAETIAHETGARADYTLFGDTLGPVGSAGATYLAMERANAEAMARGFTGGKIKCAGAARA